MNKLVPSLIDTIFNAGYEITPEIAEVGIDSIFDSGMLQDIPIIRSVTALCKMGYNLHERNLLKQTISFITGFKDGSINEEILEKYRLELENNSKKAEEELGRVIIILGNYIEDLQSKVLGAFYNSYIKEAISWAKFCELSEANRRIFISDYKVLLEANSLNGLNLRGRELYQIDRLISLGLIESFNRPGGIFLDNSVQRLSQDIYTVNTSSFGKTFCQHMPSIL